MTPHPVTSAPSESLVAPALEAPEIGELRADFRGSLHLAGDPGYEERRRVWNGSIDRHPRDLSVGERERLALAAVIALEPELLVLDEPTRGVDPERKADLARLLRAEAPSRGTIVVTHDLPWAADVADRVVELDVREGVRV